MYFSSIVFIYSDSAYIPSSSSSIIVSYIYETKFINGSVADLARGSGLKGIEHLLINLANGESSKFYLI